MTSNATPTTSPRIIWDLKAGSFSASVLADRFGTFTGFVFNAEGERVFQRAYETEFEAVEATLVELGEKAGFPSMV